MCQGLQLRILSHLKENQVKHIALITLLEQETILISPLTNNILILATVRMLEATITKTATL